MAQLNHKYEAAADAARRHWQGLRQHYREIGAASLPGAGCPYCRTSFAAIHWRQGQEQTALTQRRDDAT